MAEELAAVLNRLWQTIGERRRAEPDASYTARLLSRGPEKVAQKFGEEAIEAVIEGVRMDGPALIRESADVLYHLFVLWAAIGVSPADVAAELARREGTSGIEEKARRKD